MLTHLAEGCLKAKGMLTSGQVEVEGTIVIAKGLALPVILIIKCDFLYFFKRNFSVDHQHTARHATSGVVLAALNGDVIISGFRHVNFPLDPLTCGLPSIAAGVVQNGLGYAIGAGGRRRAIIFCIQGRFGTTYGILSFNDFI